MKPTTRRCPECGCERLREFRSLNLKQCDECLRWMKWTLGAGQAPLVGSSRDRYREEAG